MLPLKIDTEKVVNRGLKARKIIKIEGDSLNKLPYRYVNGSPHCGVIQSEDKKINSLYIEAKDDMYSIIEGEIYPEFYFQKIFPIIEQCGHRLHVISEKVKALKETWHGQENFEI